MTKEEIVFRMLAYHKLIKLGEEEFNDIITETWLQDLEGFSVEEIAMAWKSTRARAQFFGLPELMKDLIPARDHMLSLKAMDGLNLALSAKGDLGRITDLFVNATIDDQPAIREYLRNQTLITNGAMDKLSALFKKTYVSMAKKILDGGETLKITEANGVSDDTEQASESVSETIEMNRAWFKAANEHNHGRASVGDGQVFSSTPFLFSDKNFIDKIKASKSFRSEHPDWVWDTNMPRPSRGDFMNRGELGKKISELKNRL